MFRVSGKALSNPHSLTPLVVAMGFVGASLRYILETILPAGGGFPFATLIANIFGCFMLEIINQHIAVRTKLPGPLAKSMGIGLIGAFTTVSAFSTESLSFLQSGRYGLFALYMAATVATTFVAAWFGKIVADKLGKRALANGNDQRGDSGMRESRVGSDSGCVSGQSHSIVEESEACSGKEAKR